MANPPITAADRGRKCVFISKRTSDPIAYKGTILGLVSADIAAAYGDIVSYNGAVRHSDSAVPEDINLLDFFIIQLEGQDENQIGALRRPFAKEWIQENTLSFIDVGTKVIVEVTDPTDGDPLNILTLLRSAGYICRITG